MKKSYFISPLILQKLIWVPTRLILGFFARFEVRGLDNLKNIKGNVILACNHSGELDPILPPAALPFWSHLSPMFYASREKSFYEGAGWRRHFYGGNFFKAWGAYQVIIGLHDYEKALANQLQIIRDGGTLCIFPEGKTTPNGKMQSIKGGVAYLSYTTGVPIVPVRLEGTFRFSLNNFLRRRIKLKVIFGEPIHAPNLDKENISVSVFKEHANMVMSVVDNMI